jgi:uncharacterized protein YkwD
MTKFSTIKSYKKPILHASSSYQSTELFLQYCRLQNKMGLRKTPVVLICIFTLTLLHLSLAQDTQQDYLDGHNTARTELGLPPLTWDDTVAAYAQNYANTHAYWRLQSCALSGWVLW